MPVYLGAMMMMIIIINEKISVAFSPKTARTRNTKKTTCSADRERNKYCTCVVVVSCWVADDSMQSVEDTLVVGKMHQIRFLPGLRPKP